MRRFSYLFILPEDNKEDSNLEEAIPSIEVGDTPLLRADFEELKADVLQTAKISLEDDLGEMNKAVDNLKSELKLIFISDQLWATANNNRLIFLHGTKKLLFYSKNIIIIIITFFLLKWLPMEIWRK